MWGKRYRNWGVVRLTTYEAAARHERNVKPIRGDKNGTKPLGDRAKKYFNIRKDEQTQDIIVRMHNTDIVRYHKDDTLTLNNGGWVSPSTHDMFFMLIGLTMQTFNNRPWVDCFISNAEGQTKRGDYPFPNNEPVKAVRHEHGWLLEGIGLTVVHHINRKAANKVRKDYTNFKSYLTGLVKLRTETQTRHYYNGDEEQQIVKLSREELKEHGLDEPSTVVFADHRCASRADNLKGLMLSNRTEDHYRAALTIMRSSHYSRYWIGANGLIVEPSRILKTFDQLLLFIHRREVLEKKIITKGTMVKDVYASWVGA